MKDVDPDEQTVFVADNVDEFVERTRLKQILEARDKAAEALRDAEMRRMNAQTNGMSRAEAARAAGEPARAAVESYILECEQIYRGTDHGRELWKDADLAEIDVREAISITQRDDIKEINTLKLDGATLEPGRPISLDGVKDFVGLSPDILVTYERELPRRGSPTETVTQSLEWTMPLWVTREAFRLTNELLADSELGVKVGTEDENGEWDTDYRDSKQ